MTALEQEHSVEVVFWDRCLDVRTPYSIPVGVKAHSIAIPGPQGQWIRRIIPLLEFRHKSLKVLQNIGPDVIHCGGLDMLFVAHSYKRFVDRNASLVYEIADLREVVYNTDRDLKSRILKKFFQTWEKHLCKRVSLLVVTSPYFWDNYYCAFVPKEKVLFIPNTPEYNLFSHYKKKPHDGFTIGFIGQIRYPKQIKILIDASEDIQGVRVFLAGSGPSYEEIRDYCAEKEHVLFHGPYNYQEDIISLYSEIDCVYSVYDTSRDNVRVALPNRLYEAIACELPVLVADNTALADFVTKHRIGFAISDTDVSGLRSLIARLSVQGELLESTREHLRELKPLYSAEVGYELLLQAYGQLEKLRD